MENNEIIKNLSNICFNGKGQPHIESFIKNEEEKKEIIEFLKTLNNNTIFDIYKQFLKKSYNSIYQNFLYKIFLYNEAEELKKVYEDYNFILSKMIEDYKQDNLKNFNEYININYIDRKFIKIFNEATKNIKFINL